MDIIIKVEKIHRLPDGSRLKAFADISINNALIVKGLRVVDGKTGPFISMPQEQGRDHKWYAIVRCLNTDIQAQISDVVLAAYNNSIKEEVTL